MTLSRALVATGLTAVLVGVAPSAFAQHRGGSQGGGRSQGSAVNRGGTSGRSQGAAVNRGGTSGRSQSQSVAPRSAPSSRGVYAGRANTYTARGYSGVHGGSYAVHGGGYAVHGGYYGPRYYAPRYYSHYAPVHFYSPYYVFRPRVSIGFGIWAGFPLAYSSAYYYPYYDPYAYAAPAYPAYSYPPPASAPYPPAGTYPPQGNYPPASYPSQAYPERPQGTVGVQPSPANTGGLSFEITPSDAQLIVDGNPIGTVGQFTPSTQPLGLPAGRHHIEVRANGYRTMDFDVDIVAGQVIPYQGQLER